MSDEQSTAGAVAASRRALLAGAGAVGATVVLAACGGGSEEPPTTGGNTGDSTSSPASAGQTLAKTSDIPVGGGKIFPSDGVVVTQPTAGQFKGFTSTCTHQQCPVANVDGGTINCTCHGSQYSISDGSVKRGPATRALRAMDITVSGGEIKLG